MMIGEKSGLDMDRVRLNFIFDNQGKLGAEALAWWDVFKQALGRDEIQILEFPPTFQSDRKALPLQAADLYAWHARHAFEGGDESVRTGAVINVLKPITPIGGMVTREQMQDSLPELLALSEKYGKK